MTVHDYNCVLEGWARSGAAGDERCKQILRGMQEEGDEAVQPDLSSYKPLLETAENYIYSTCTACLREHDSTVQ